MLSALRLALRSLAKAPGFTAVAVLTLALGLGASTAIFNAIHAVFLAPLPYPDDARVVSVRAMVKREARERRAFSAPDFRDYREQTAASFSAFAAVSGFHFILAAGTEAERVRGERVSSGYFAALGIAPALGRGFTAAEDAAPGGTPLVIVSHGFWRDRLGASPSALGQPLRLNDAEHTIIGVMPPRFRGLDETAQLWVPLPAIGAGEWNNRRARGLEGVARLRPGVTLAHARAALAATGLALAAQHPDSNTNYSADLAPLREEFFGELRRPLLVLLGAAALLLAIACVNVANLLLVRLAARRREIAVRLALGAGRRALAGLFFGEALVLAALAGGAGVLLAAWSAELLRSLAPVALPAFVDLGLHGPAVAFATAVAVACAIGIGALPASLAGRGDLQDALKDAGRSGGAGVAAARSRAALVALEIALSLALLVASALLVRSFGRLVAQWPGFRTERVTTARLLLPPQRYDAGARRTFARALIERASALPGVHTAALASDTPLDGNSNAVFTSVEGDTASAADNEGRAHFHVVTRDFFAAAGLTLLRGETFAPSYAEGAETAAIVSERFARRHWPAGEAVGRRFKPAKAAQAAPWLRIVGVVAETKFRNLAADLSPDPDIYVSYEQRPLSSFALVLHTAGDAPATGPALRALASSLDPAVPVFGLATIEERVASSSATQRFSAQLMAGFAAAALLLAAVGLYGVVSFAVGQRTAEIGVRMALGARPADIGRLVLGGIARPVVVGLVTGTALTLACARALEPLLFQVDPRDPSTYALVAVAIVAVALLAAWLPARRATRVNPVEALRAE